MPIKEVDPKDFFAKKPRKWDQRKYETRTPLSIVIERPVRLRRAPSGSNDWRHGKLHIVDDQTGELLATVSPSELADPKTRWPLRADC